MSVSIQASLADPQRRLLNLLYDHAAGAGCQTERALTFADCDLDQVRNLLVPRNLIAATFTDGTSAKADLLERHADYPHHPGRHFGCTACESRCHCDTEPGTEPCVYEGAHHRRPGAGDPMRHSRLKLTVTGRGWVRNNPLNKLIRTMDGYAHGTFRLFDADRVAGSDRGLILGLVSDGWATLHFAGDLKETGFGGIGAYEFRHSRDFVLIPTAKVRELLVSDG